MPLLRWTVAKLGETITETLESIPRQWKVIQNWCQEVRVPCLRNDQGGARAIAPDRTGPGRVRS